MWQQLIGHNELSLLVDLMLSLVAGFLIGLERESRGKDAGINMVAVALVPRILHVNKMSPEAREVSRVFKKKKKSFKSSIT